jgi:predicted dehydrogenase
MNPIRLAFLGSLEQATAFAEASEHLVGEDLADVVACAGVAPGTALPPSLARQQPRTYADSGALLAAETLDAAVVAGFLPERYKLALTLMEQGIHVLTLPPVATIQEHQDLVTIQERAGVFCAVGFAPVALPAAVLLKQRLCEGVLGAVRHVGGMSCCRAPRLAGSAWSGKIEHGGRYLLDGPFQGEGGDALAVAAFLAGEDLHAFAAPSWVQAEVYSFGEREAGDAACLRAEAGGVTLTVAATTAATHPRPSSWKVTGERGDAVLTADGHLTILGEVITPAEHETGALVLLRRFLEVVLESDEPLLAPLGTFRSWVLLLNGAYESTGQVRLLESRDALDAVVERAAMEDALFSELGVPGAVGARRFALSGYDAFPAGLTTG